MAKRAGIYQMEIHADYTTMVFDNFDWQMWIQQETRRRRVVAARAFALYTNFLTVIQGCLRYLQP